MNSLYNLDLKGTWVSALGELGCGPIFSLPSARPAPAPARASSRASRVPPSPAAAATTVH